jgi:hypothetical protein
MSDLIIMGPEFVFNVQPIDSTSKAIIVDLSAPPIGLDVSKNIPWGVAAAIVTDVTTSTVIYDQVGGINDFSGPGGGISSCHFISNQGTTPVLFALRFNSAPWNGSATPTPIFSVALTLQYNGYIAPVLPPNS